MPQKKSQIAKDILRRVRWLYAIFLIVAIAIFARVIWIQYGPEGGELRDMAEKISYERMAIPAERGDILARDGRILATSIPTYEIRMDFAAAGLQDSVFLKNVDSLALCLANFFRDRSKEAYKSMLVSARNDRAANRYRLISPRGRRVNYLEEKEIKNFPIFRLGANRGGYISVQVNQRLMPHGSLARRTIGMTNQSGVKLGVEGAFDEQLRGEDGSSLMQRVSGSFRVPVPDVENVEPVNGMDIVTTLDVDIQDVAESMLKRQLELGNADWGTVILMEVATGDIHAMSNITRTSPGNYVEDFNYAIGRRLEPGSTFKLATLITLLEDAGMSLDDMIDCENGVATVNRVRLVDDHPEKVIPLRRVFEVSSNIGFAKAVNEKYGDKPAGFVDYIKNMGLGMPLDMQIEGERRPLIKDPANRDYSSLEAWDGTTLVKMAYGYALEITPMHTLMLYNAVANDGRMMRPRLVKEVQSYGQTVRTFPSEVINPAICSPSTLRLVRESLQGVAAEGTGRYVMAGSEYIAAVKTGTAQVAFDNGGYTDSRGGRQYLATFVGYFPADNPKYTCLVAIKTYNGPGHRNTYYGASLSGPVFKAIADRVYAANPWWHGVVESNGERTAPAATDVKNGYTPELREAGDELGTPLMIDRATQLWSYIDRTTPADSTVNRGRPYIAVDSAANDDGTVPDVRGMGLKDAVYLLESKGLKVSYSGAGRITSQSVAPGGQAVVGETVFLTLRL